MGGLKLNNKGFTLIEIIISLAILSIVILPVIGMFSFSAQNNHKSTRNTVALTVARDILDRIKTGDINQENQVTEINKYRDKYGVEISIAIPEEKSENSLEKLKVYVAPKRGMDAKTEGILLASYTTNVYVSSLDTSPPNNGGEAGNGGNDGGDGGIGEPPPSGGDENSYWDWYNSLVEIIHAVGVIVVALTIIPVYLWLVVDELDTPIDGIIASYDILTNIYNNHGIINWGLFKNEVRNRFGIHLNIRDIIGLK